MLPWKLRKRHILPASQNLLSVYFSLAKFQLVSCNLSLAMIWQRTYTHKLPKLCSATLIESWGVRLTCVDCNRGCTVLYSANIVGTNSNVTVFSLFSTTITAPQEKYRGECNCKHDLSVYLQWTTRGYLQSLCLARTFALKPRTAVACRGTPLSGHTRK